jgi:predicted nuclease of predicted toxin-antitoxin system
MRVLTDENIPLMTIGELRRQRHDVRDVHKAGQKGLLDAEIWARAQEEGRLLITTDKGFAQRRSIDHYGVLTIRLHQPNRYRIHERVMWAISHFPEAEWRGMVVTVRDRVVAVSRYARE